MTDEVEAVPSMQRCPPHQSPPVTASLHRGSLLGCVPARYGANKKISPQKGADQKIRSAPSIYGSCSMATSCKFDSPVSGGAYQDVRRVTTEWNAELKHWGLPEFRGRTYPTVTKRPFSPPSFPARRKRRGRRRRVRNDHDGTSPRYSRSLFSSVLISSFPNRKLNLRFGFYSKFATTSQSAALTASLPLLSLRDISP